MSQLFLTLHQSSRAVLGERSPVLDLPEGLSQIGPQVLAFGFSLAEPHEAKVTLSSGDDQLVLWSCGVCVL